MLLRNTLLYNLVFIVLNIVIPVALAVHDQRAVLQAASSKAYQTMMFFPTSCPGSWSATLYSPSSTRTKGLVNRMVSCPGRGARSCGIPNLPTGPFILVFMKVWKGVGYNMVVYLATITGIDQQPVRGGHAGRRHQVAAGTVHHPAAA